MGAGYPIWFAVNGTEWPPGRRRTGSVCRMAGEQLENAVRVWRRPGLREPLGVVAETLTTSIMTVMRSAKPSPAGKRGTRSPWPTPPNATGAPVKSPCRRQGRLSQGEPCPFGYREHPKDRRQVVPGLCCAGMTVWWRDGSKHRPVEPRQRLTGCIRQSARMQKLKCPWDSTVRYS